MKPNKPDLSNVSILTVDDSEVNLKLLDEILSDSNLITLNCGNDCLIYLREYIPDIIIMDVMMPDMNGYEVLAQIDKINKFKDIPVIILTAMPLTEARQMADYKETNGFLEKPFRPKDIRNLIAEILDISK